MSRDDKSLKELKEIIADNFVKLFCSHNPNEKLSVSYLKKQVSFRLGDVKGREQIVSILKKYYYTAVNGKEEQSLIEHLLFLINLLYEN